MVTVMQPDESSVRSSITIKPTPLRHSQRGVFGYTSSKDKTLRLTHIAILLSLIFVSFASLPASASNSPALQAFEEYTKFHSGRQSPLAQITWSPPTNLSRSGAASQSRLVASLNGTNQAFWMDSFDGLVTAVYNGSVWSLPVLVPILPPNPNQNPATPPSPPEMMLDGSDRIHAFWFSPPDPATSQPALNENLMLLGTTTWSEPLRIAESALVYDTAALAANEIYMGYIRNYKSLLFEPGVYVRKTVGGVTWQSAVSVQNSIYYRNLAAPPALIKTASAGSLVSMAWTEPRLGMIYSADSFDQGNTWTEPKLIEFAGTVPSNPLVLPLPEGGLLRTWQDASQTSCTLYQQRLDAAGTVVPQQPAETATTGPAVTPPIPGPVIPAAEWSQPVRIFADLQTCPTSSNFILDGTDLYWYWGEGTSTINLTAWDAGSSQWYEPHAISLNFEDAETRRFVQLDELSLAIAGGRIMVAGTDLTGGEVWASSADISALEFVSAPPSPWLEPVLVSQAGEQVREPAVAVDYQGWEHFVWSQELDSSGSSLYYSRFDNLQTLQPVEIFKGGDGTISRQPSMIADSQGQLHLSWSGGTNGLLMYSHAMADMAGSAFGWVPSQNLDENSTVSRPQITQDPSGRLYIIYAIPRNEQRGVYLVYSDDSGENWSAPIVVFDAVSAGWEGVDRPVLAVSPDGGVHAAFSRVVGTGALPTDGIFYTRALLGSDSSGFDTVTWSEPFEIAPDGNDWPRLVFIAGQLHLLFSDNISIGHRWLNTSQQKADGAGWGDVSRVPGWSDLSFSGEPPFSTAVDAYNLYLVSASTGGTGLYYSVWTVAPQDPTVGRWSQQEVFNPGGQWTNSDSTAVASTVPSGGKLLVAWLASAIVGGQATPVPENPGILFSIRSLDAVQPPAAPTTEPVADTSEQPTPSAEPTASPTPLVISNSDSEGSQLPVSPQALGGGLAAIIVIIIFVGILMRGRTHTP